MDCSLERRTRHICLVRAQREEKQVTDYFLSNIENVLLNGTQLILHQVLKGYLTNTDLCAKEVRDQYNGLWVIERAYRVTKGTLELQPVFHFTVKRIEAHVCICFVAYKVYKELERILRLSGINLSVDKVLNIAKTITTLKIKLPASGETLDKTMLITQKHNSIRQLFDENFWENF